MSSKVLGLTIEEKRRAEGKGDGDIEGNGGAGEVEDGKGDVE